jgi:hypothetical protein
LIIDVVGIVVDIVVGIVVAKVVDVVVGHGGVEDVVVIFDYN